MICASEGQHPSLESNLINFILFLPAPRFLGVSGHEEIETGHPDSFRTYFVNKGGYINARFRNRYWNSRVYLASLFAIASARPELLKSAGTRRNIFLILIFLYDFSVI